MQEGVFRSADFKYSGMVTLCTTTMYCFSALVERIRSNDTVRKAGSSMSISTNPPPPPVTQ